MRCCGLSNQAQLGFEDDGAGAFRPDERPGDVETVLGQQLVEVVARDPARDLRKPVADLTARIDRESIAAPRRSRRGGRPAAMMDVELCLRRRADGQLGAVVEQNPQLVDVVDGLAGEQRVRAAGVVADHAAERAAAVRRRIGTERQVVRLGAAAQRIEHDARAARAQCASPGLISRIRFMYFVKSSTTATLQHCPARLVPGAAREHRRAETSGTPPRGAHIVFDVARHDEADGNLAVVRCVASRTARGCRDRSGPRR